MNTSGDLDVSPPDVIGGAGHSIPPEGPTSPPYVQVLKYLKSNYKKHYPMHRNTNFTSDYKIFRTFDHFFISSLKKSVIS